MSSSTIPVFAEKPSAATTAVSTTAVSAPSKPARVNVRYDDICRTARMYALRDFARENQYHHLVRTLKESGQDVQVVKVSEDQAAALVRATKTRFLKEHRSATWSASLYQFGLFGLVGVGAVATAVTSYIGMTNNRLVLAAVPVLAAMTWRTWLILEAAWAEKRYVDQAAQLREDRKGNPLNRVVKRRAASDAAALASKEEEGGEVVSNAGSPTTN